MSGPRSCSASSIQFAALDQSPRCQARLPEQRHAVALARSERFPRDVERLMDRAGREQAVRELTMMFQHRTRCIDVPSRLFELGEQRLP